MNPQEKSSSLDNGEKMGCVAQAGEKDSSRDQTAIAQSEDSARPLSQVKEGAKSVAAGGGALMAAGDASKNIVGSLKRPAGDDAQPSRPMLMRKRIKFAMDDVPAGGPDVLKAFDQARRGSPQNKADKGPASDDARPSLPAPKKPRRDLLKGMFIPDDVPPGPPTHPTPQPKTADPKIKDVKSMKMCMAQDCPFAIGNEHMLIWCEYQGRVCKIRNKRMSVWGDSDEKYVYLKRCMACGGELRVFMATE